MEAIQIKKISEGAILPKRATEGSAGMDLCACLDCPVTIPAGGNALIPTGIAIKLPSASYAAFVFARSGLAIKHGIGLLNGVGVIDSDYTGEIKVGLVNQKGAPYTLQPGERVAQLVILPVGSFPLVEVAELEKTERGDGGFGSTGKI